MKRMIAVIAYVTVACGGKSPPPKIDNHPPPGTTAKVPDGIHGCQFIIEGTGYGPHRCDVSGAKVDKLTGMEPFSGTLAPAGDDLELDATMGCTDLTTKCSQPFSVTLHKDGGFWRGTVVPGDGAPEEWFLDSATFELQDDTEYGGQYYGGGSYGGE